ncbi:hypothetical protein ACFXJ5_08965 [Streptomyces sp. NPDC059373]
MSIVIRRTGASGIIATGADQFAALLLTHAGFTADTDPATLTCHRLPATDTAESKVDQAIRMLCIAGYRVQSDPGIWAYLANVHTPAPDKDVTRAADQAVNALIARLYDCTGPTGLAEIANQVLHPEHGALVYLREFLTVLASWCRQQQSAEGDALARDLISGTYHLDGLLKDYGTLPADLRALARIAE